MKDDYSGWDLYGKRYGHLFESAFPLPEDLVGGGLSRLEYVASQLLAAWCGSFASSADRVIVDGPTVVREAIVDVVDVAELFLEEIESRRRERIEACDREVAEEKARREAIGAESKTFISGFRWKEWIDNEIEGSNEDAIKRALQGTYVPWSERVVPKTLDSVKDDGWWLERLVIGELESLGFQKDDAAQKTNRFWGFQANFGRDTYCSFFYSNKKGGEDSLREEYNLHAIARLPDGLPGIQIWTYNQPTEHPVRQTQIFLRHFCNLGLILEMPQMDKDLPF
jgi:hypothetical protein